MIPISILPDIAASLTATMIVRLLIPKLIKRGTEEAISKSIENLQKKNVEKDKKLNNKEITKIAAKASSVPNMDEDAKIRYCIKLSYIYGKYGDKDILEILKERGCIDDEDLKEIEENGYTETRNKER